MQIRQRGLVALAAAVLLLPGLAACGGTGESSAQEENAVNADPKLALLAGTKEIDKGNFRFTMSGDSISADGSVHAESRSAQMKLTASEEAEDFSLTMDLIYIEPESWVKLEFTGLENLPGAESFNSGKYQHLDRSKIKDIEDLQFNFDEVDPAGSALITNAIVDAEKTAEGEYTGTVDLTKATDAGLTDEETVKALGVEASKLPFTAKLDGQGRLTELTVKLPAAGETAAHELKVTYEYGAGTPAQKPPADEVVEATDETYEMFRS